MMSPIFSKQIKGDRANLYVHSTLYPFLSNADGFGYQQPVRDWIAHSSKNRTFIHAGGSIGIHSINAALAGASRILSFEPLPLIYTLHLDNYWINKKLFPKLTNIYNCALGDVSGLRSIYVPDTDIAINTKVNWEIPVPRQLKRINVIRLETVIYGGEQTVVLVDTEGSEGRVIRGMGSHLLSPTNRILVSVSEKNLAFYGDTAEGLFKEWEGHNFNFSFLPQEFEGYSFKGAHAYSSQEAMEVFNSLPEKFIYVELSSYGDVMYDV